MMENAVRFGLLNYTILTVYVAAMIAVGFYFARKQESVTDFFLAGRKLPWLAVGMSMYASVTSAMTFLGLPGLAYGHNISLIVVCLMSPLIAPLLIYLIYPLYRKLGLTTSYEYISLRFGKRARISVAALFVLARLSWLGTVIYAPALALHVTTGISLSLGIIIIGLFATVYCVLGGLSAVVWTDVPQFIIMIGGAILIGVMLHHMVPDGMIGILREGHLADKLAVFDWTLRPDAMTALAVAIAYAFMLVQDYGVDQVSVQRLLAVKSDRGVSRAILFNALVDFFIIGLLLLIGLGLYVYYQHQPGNLPADMKADRILPWFILHELPAGISGFMIAAIFAAAMSSVDSGLNSLSTVILKDVAQPISRHAPEPTVMAGRILTGTLGIFATIVAMFVYQYIGGIIKAFYTFMGLFSAPVLALFMLGMFSRRASFAGWLPAAVLSIFMILTLQQTGLLHEIHFFPLSAIFTMVVGHFLSRFMPSGHANPAYRWRNVVRS